MSTETKTKEIEQGGIVFTAMLGKVLWNRLDLAAGLRYNDATLKTGLVLGPFGDEDRFQIQSELSFRSEEIDQDSKLHDRLYTIIFPSKSPYLHAVYLTAGLDTFARVTDRVAFFYGGGLQFDDDDIKLLFSFL